MNKDFFNTNYSKHITNAPNEDILQKDGFAYATSLKYMRPLLVLDDITRTHVKDDGFWYEYSNLDEYYAKLYKYNNAIVLCLSARADIGVHYEGWTEKEISEYFSTNNCPLGKDAIKQLYNIILEEPGDYLPYAVGYVEINRMLLEAKEKNGNDFNIKDFHTAILNAGPAPFNSIKSQ